MDFLMVGLYLRWLPRTPLAVILYLLAIVLSTLSTDAEMCPRLCRCDNKLVYCEKQNLTKVPQNLSGVMGLSLQENGLEELRKGQFSSLVHLTWLYLDRNVIWLVEENAFQRLRRVKELNLSSNKIEILPNSTFRPMPNLRILDLSHNKLLALDPDLFHGLRKLNNLHLRHNSLKSVPVRIFQDCRSMQFLDLGFNQLQSLARNSFAGLFKLSELHLEHNKLVKVNLAHFPRLISLRSLYMSHNRASVVLCTLHWVWPLLERIDLSANHIEYIEPHVFTGVPNLKLLHLDSNRLTYVDKRILDSWAVLSSITLSRNEWDCSRNICALATWLSRFQGRHDNNLLCSTPITAQGEDLMDAVHAFQLCEKVVEAPAQTNLVTRDWERSSCCEGFTRYPYVSLHTDRGAPSTPSLPYMEMDYEDEHVGTMQIHKVVTGTMALIFSFLIMVLLLYVSWKCLPAGVRQLRRGVAARRRRKKQKQSMQKMAALSPQEYYMDYKPGHMENALVIINDFGSCACQQQPAKECEV